MINKQSIHHPKGYLKLSISKILERTSYYGVRALMVLYLTGEIINMSRTDALAFYGWFTMLILFAGIIGGLIGDFGIGNRKSIILGASLQALGAFTLCFSNDFSLYAGFGLFYLGNGIFVPNFNSVFGKQYLNKTRLLDSGFMILFIAANVGGFLGPLIIGPLGESQYSYGFVTAGFIILLSLMFFLIAKPNLEITQEENEHWTNTNLKIIIITLLCIGAFWGLYEVAQFAIIDIQQKLSKELGIPRISSSLISSTSFTLPFAIIAAFYWSKNYSSQLTKITLGFIFTIASYLMLFFLQEFGNQFFVFIISMALLGLGEIFIAPVLFSVLTQYTKPKYLTIAMSIAFVPTRVFSALLGLFNEQFHENPLLAVIVPIIGLGLITISLKVLAKKNPQIISIKHIENEKNG